MDRKQASVLISNTFWERILAAAQQKDALKPLRKGSGIPGLSHSVGVIHTSNLSGLLARTEDALRKELQLPPRDRAHFGFLDGVAYPPLEQDELLAAITHVFGALYAEVAEVRTTLTEGVQDKGLSLCLSKALGAFVDDGLSMLQSVDTELRDLFNLPPLTDAPRPLVVNWP